MRVGVFVTHPIQYQAPLWRKLAAAPGIELVVHYFSDTSLRGGVDQGFGVPVAWDVDLLSGYDSVFLSRDAELNRPGAISIPNVRSVLSNRYDWIIIAGYIHQFERQIIYKKSRFGYKILMRGEFSDERLCLPSFSTRLRSRLRDVYLHSIYRRIDRFAVVSTAANRHLDRLGIRCEQRFSSPYAVDTDLIDAQTRHFRRATCRRELGIDDKFCILFSGKLVPRKAPMCLAKAVSMMSDRQQVVLLMLGDGPLRSELESRFRPLFGDQLVLPGFVNQSQLGRYFSAADLCVLPSEFETWGLVVNEAMQFGLPVIVSDRVGCRHDLIEPGITGEVFPHGDAMELCNKLEQFMHDKDGLVRTGKAAGERIQDFTIERAASGIVQAITC